MSDSQLSGYGIDTVEVDNVSIDTSGCIGVGVTAANWNFSGSSVYPSTTGLYSTPSSGSYVINSNSGITTPSSSLQVRGDAEFNGDIKVKGVSLTEFMDKISERLIILTPDPAKLEKYQALKRAYDHYLLMEKLIMSEDSNDAGQ